MGFTCFFNTDIALGGSGKWHNVSVVAHPISVLLHKLKATDIPNVSIEIRNLGFLNPFKRSALTKLLKKHSIDTMVMNLSRNVNIAGPCTKIVGIKRIIYRRGSAIPIKNTLLNRHYHKNVINEVLANSEATKKTVLANNPQLFPKEKIRVIYNGINIVGNPLNWGVENSRKYKKFTLINLGKGTMTISKQILIREKI